MVELVTSRSIGRMQDYFTEKEKIKKRKETEVKTQVVTIYRN